MAKVCVMLLLTLARCMAAFEPSAPGPGAAGMGGAAVAKYDGGWNGILNPALLGSVSGLRAGVSYEPVRFGFGVLARMGVLSAVPTGAGTFAINVSHFGFSLLHETDIGLRWGSEVTAGLNIGCAVHAYNLNIAGYGSAWAAAIDVGGFLKIADGLDWGFLVSNLGGAVIGDSDEPIPRVMVSGIAFEPLAGLILAADLQKDIRYPLTVHVGVEYHPVAPVYLRIGSSLAPSSFAAGFGSVVLSVQFDYGYTHHPILGESHQISLLFGGEQ